MQYWSSQWGKDNKQMTEGQVLKHNLTRRYLVIKKDITIDYMQVYKKKRLDLNL